MINSSNLIKKELVESLAKEDEDYNDIYETVELIRDEVYHKDLYNGRSRESIKAGIILAACRHNNIPRTPNDISDLFDVSVRDVILTYRYICRHIEFLSVQPTKWTIFLEELAEELDISDETISISFDIGKKGESSGLISGRKPRSYAASCIYASVKFQEETSDSWVTQRRLSEESDVGSSTIRKTYRELLDNY
jgi:transcription initiation factor TFIIIB Brf1 subunit/transcription initiation factor TFIIB